MNTTQFGPLAGPYRRRTRWYKFRRGVRSFIRFILSSHP